LYWYIKGSGIYINLHQICLAQQQYLNSQCRWYNIYVAHHTVHLYLKIELPRSVLPSLVTVSCDFTNPKGPSMCSIIITDLRLQGKPIMNISVTAHPTHPYSGVH
jgi:hypothetical protein